jgi:translocator protein
MKINTNLKKLFLLIASFVFCYAIAWTGSLFVESSIGSWYGHLKKAVWNPPPIAFSIVWNILYGMIAVSFWKILCIHKIAKRKALLPFFIQMFFNFTWTYLFFYLQSPLLGLINIVLLTIFIAWNIQAFYVYSKSAAWLLVPYFIWVGYATTLNFYIWCFN